MSTQVPDTEQVWTRTYALDPSASQNTLMHKHVGATRFVYNHMLQLIQENLETRSKERDTGTPDEELTPPLGWSHYSLRKTWNDIKEDVAGEWWREISKEAFSTGCANLAAALLNYRNAKTGKRKGSMGFPRFKSKARSSRSTTFSTGVLRVEESLHHITMPVIGRVHTLESTRDTVERLRRGGRVTKITIKYVHGRWYAVVAGREPRVAASHPHPGTVVGVDLGVKDLLVAATPDGVEVLRVSVPKAARDAEVRLRRYQRMVSRRQVGDSRKGVKKSNRARRAEARVARQYARQSRVIEDVVHKASAELSARFETVVLESLSPGQMAARGGSRKRGLNRAIYRAGMGRLARFLEYKSLRAGGGFVCVDRWYPSSKTCSYCGAVRAKLSLSERTFVCFDCGGVLDRDVNAAVNLACRGVEFLAGSTPVSGRGAPVVSSWAFARVDGGVVKRQPSLNGVPAGNGGV